LSLDDFFNTFTSPSSSTVLNSNNGNNISKQNQLLDPIFDFDTMFNNNNNNNNNNNTIQTNTNDDEQSMEQQKQKKIQKIQKTKKTRR